MSKKTKAAKAPTKTNGKKAKTVQPSPVALPMAAPEAPAQPKGRPMLRAIRVSPQLLEAAKAYKRATGISFYQLGLEAITDRLVKEGYLEQPTVPKPSAREAEIAKP